MALIQFLLRFLTVTLVVTLAALGRQVNGQTSSAPVIVHTTLCQGHPTGTLIPDSSCASCFYECDNGVAYRFQCPSHLIFSDGAHRCVEDPSHPVVVPCLGNSHFDCHGKTDGFYPDPSDKTRFHGCDHGCASDLVCGPSTSWDPSRNVCAYDSNANPHQPDTPAPVTHPHHPDDTTPAPWTPPPTHEPTTLHHDQETTPTHWMPHEEVTTQDPWHHNPTTQDPWHHDQPTTQDPNPHDQPTTQDPWHHEQPTTHDPWGTPATPVTHHDGEPTTTVTSHHNEVTDPWAVQPSTRGRHGDGPN